MPGFGDVSMVPRAWRLVYQGLRNHAHVEVRSVGTARYKGRYDFIICHNQEVAYTHPQLCYHDPERLIIMDWTDGKFCDRTDMKWWVRPPAHTLIYFKRAWVVRNKGVFARQPTCPEGVYPIDYALFDEWLMPTVPWAKRRYSILSSIRNSTRPGSPYAGGRHRVVTWLREAQHRWSGALIHPLTNMGAGGCFDRDYFSLLQSARIIVTCQPASWETDWRTWESLSTGAMIMLDQVETRMEPQLVPGVHFVQYNSSNQTDLLSKVEYYLQHPREAEAIAAAGWHFVVHHHRAVHRMDRVLAAALRARKEQNATRTMAHT